MRCLRIIVSITAVISVLLMTLFFVKNLNNNNGPKISCSVDGVIEVSTKITDQELIKFASATDTEDGDLSDKIIVERKMYFLEKGLSTITYAVSDSDNNVTKLEKNIKFVDYYSPKIILYDDLIVPINSSVDLLSCVGVEDAYEGDITHRIKMITSEFSNVVAGKYNVNFKVTNSFTDTRSINVPIIISEEDYSGAIIKLTDYIVYVPKNTKINFENYIADIISQNGTSYTKENVVIDSNEYDSKNEGAYSVYFSINSWNKTITKTRLVVVVEGE